MTGYDRPDWATDPIKARGRDTGGTIGVVEIVIPAGHGPPLHVHRNEDEGSYVLSGRIEIQRGEAFEDPDRFDAILRRRGVEPIGPPLE
ncbi:MAG TPA: hypothetical protein VHI76_02705 [Solirubrobacterales bacterium]|nr:hypothetical protein [Solirubrobacterales bacterium]